MRGDSGASDRAGPAVDLDLVGIIEVSPDGAPTAANSGGAWGLARAVRRCLPSPRGCASASTSCGPGGWPACRIEPLKADTVTKVDGGAVPSWGARASVCRVRGSRAPGRALDMNPRRKRPDAAPGGPPGTPSGIEPAQDPSAPYRHHRSAGADRARPLRHMKMARLHEHRKESPWDDVS
jgi:hypothetical protein